MSDFSWLSAHSCCAHVCGGRANYVWISEVEAGSPRDLRVSRIRFLDRYELLLIIAVILSYGSVSGFLRAWRLPEGLVRILPLVTFGIGLVAKPRILRWLASRRTAVADGARQANAGVSQG